MSAVALPTRVLMGSFFDAQRPSAPPPCALECAWAHSRHPAPPHCTAGSFLTPRIALAFSRTLPHCTTRARSPRVRIRRPPPPSLRTGACTGMLLAAHGRLALDARRCLRLAPTRASLGACVGQGPLSTPDADAAALHCPVRAPMSASKVRPPPLSPCTGLHTVPHTDGSVRAVFMVAGIRL
ncbi:hypothetical protein GGX14DRAFT_570021 [Mycena pura]|uniref:Uncharacterized protein n=1 Tax=Mycena pura TaxID=153505 RepID=A0AAD6V5L3_9AGAR|nr:hypothetical protein GGX14DRAFT_570021 [Mycena pura]